MSSPRPSRRWRSDAAAVQGPSPTATPKGHEHEPVAKNRFECSFVDRRAGSRSYSRLSHAATISAVPQISRSYIYACAAVLVAACGGNDPIAPGEETGPLTAFINGEAFVAEVATVTRAGHQIFVNAAGANQRAIGFQFPDQGPANYIIGPGNPTSAGVTIGTSSWLAGDATGSGVITVTALTQTRLEGTFVLTAIGGPNPTTLEITSGTFAIDFF